MAIIGQVERKNWKVKFLNVMIHVVLIIGAATMVYPLLLMLSGSVKSAVDFKQFTVVPEYLSSEMEGRTLLFRKHLATKYNTKVLRMSADFKDPSATFDNVMPPEYSNAKMVADYAEFLGECKKELPHYWFVTGMALETGIDALSVRNYRKFLQEAEYGGEGKEGLSKINKQFGTQYAAWDELSLPAEDFVLRRSVTDYDTSNVLKSIREFKYSKYIGRLEEVWFDIEGDMIAMLRRDISRNLKQINQTLGTKFNSWQDVTVPATVPTDNPKFALMWEDFVKGEINLDFVTVDVAKANVPWRAYLLDKYKDIATLNKILRTDYKSFDDITISATKPAGGVVRTDWQDFIKANSTPKKLWSDFLKAKYKNQVAALNKAHGTSYKTFNEIKDFDTIDISKLAADSQLLKDVQEVIKQVADNKKKELSPDALTVNTLANRYRKWLQTRFNGSVEAMNNAYCNGFTGFDVIPLHELPAGEKNLAENADWTEFVASLDPKNIALARQATSDYKAYLKKLYTKDGKCDYARMSVDYQRTIRSGEDNDIPAYLKYPEAPATDKARADYLNAIKSGKFSNMYRVSASEEFQAAWQAFLKKKYETVNKLNIAWHRAPQTFDQVSLPTREHEWNLVETEGPKLRNEYLKRNYLMVFNTLFTNGNAAVNTLIYCFLAVLAALLVNPLCAYGLSRYKPASSYKILLFLMLPMAFPGMVLGIPQFLLIKNFGLLNTFAALILPGMASGYSIFLLKGFFDSLPKELFESAAIDGASEWTVFWHIAMGLSTPILSVIALGAFTGAYGNFMMAFLLCQDKTMWTMMVYLYQLQQRAAPSVGFAALAVAAIPTLIVFVFCQNIIIKGIVVPTEK